MLVGVVSDTHGLLRPEAEAHLRGVERILHAGDVGGPEILPRLDRIAPVAAVRGNVDVGSWADALPEAITLALGPARVHMVHDVADLAPDALDGADVLIFGHSHRPSIERERGVLRLNPGSAGRRRFSLPVTLALLDLGAAGPAARIVELVPPR